MAEDKNPQENPRQIPRLPGPPQMPQNIPRPPLPEPLQMPKPKPQPLTIPKQVPEIRRPPARMVARPHVFLKVSSYKEIMDSLEEMNKQVGKIRNIVKEFEEVSRQEEQKLKIFEYVISKLNRDLLKVEGIFTEPEE